jgi:hypothetical protein
VSLDWEDREAARLAGLETGFAMRVEVDVEDLVQARLAERALEALGMARRLARAKGPAWEAMIQECGEDQ